MRLELEEPPEQHQLQVESQQPQLQEVKQHQPQPLQRLHLQQHLQIGRASCRERVLVAV